MTNSDKEIREILGDEDWKYTDKPFRLNALIEKKVREGIEANQLELANYITQHLATGDLEQALGNRLRELQDNQTKEGV